MGVRAPTSASSCHARRTLVSAPSTSYADSGRRGAHRGLAASVGRRGRPRDVRRPGDAVRAPAVLRGAADDPQPGRRRGPRAGHVPAGLPRLRRVHRGHQPAGLAVPHPHQHLHQHLPGQAAAARRRPTSPTSRTSTCTAGCGALDDARWPAARPRTSCSTCSPTTRSSRPSRSCPENFRLPVLLADVEGFAYKEIAEMLDIPIGTVMSRLHRGRKAMQKALFDYAHARGTRRAGPAGTAPTERRERRWLTATRRSRELETFLDGELTRRRAGRDPRPPRGLPRLPARRSTSTPS